jgi:type I restriction enzyme S subunit
LSIQDDTRVPFLPMETIPIGRVRVSGYQERLGSALSSGTYVENGDLLVAKITPSFENGKQAIVDWDRPFGFATTEVIPIQEVEGVSDKFFLFHLLLHPAIRADLAGKMDGTTGRQRLSKEVLGSRLIPLPPLPEQRKIAAVLGVVQRAIEQQSRLLQLTAELKKTLLHQLFTQGLRGEPQKQTEIGPVPESWEVVRLGSIGKVVTGSTPKTKVPEYYSPPEVDFIAPADLGRTRLIYDSEKKISMAGLQIIRRLPKDAVMCVCIGSSIGKVGMTEKESSATNQQINSIVCGERHESAFIYYLLSYLRDYWRGFATFGPVPILSKGSFVAIKIAVPPTKEEESEISRSLCALDVKAEVHMRKHAALTALFRTTLHQLMTAQLRVDQLVIEEFDVGSS